MAAQLEEAKEDLQAAQAGGGRVLDKRQHGGAEEAKAAGSLHNMVAIVVPRYSV